jgi:hypothetical protein
MIRRKIVSDPFESPTVEPDLCWWQQEDKIIVHFIDDKIAGSLTFNNCIYEYESIRQWNVEGISHNLWAVIQRFVLKNHTRNHLLDDPGVLARQIPGIKQVVTCPACKNGEIKGITNSEYMATTGESLMSVIIHLNDRHKWTREAIADWIETLDEIPTFTEEVEHVEKKLFEPTLVVEVQSVL